MAYKGVVQAQCPFCSESFEAEVWSVVRGDLDGEIADRMLSGEINFLACPACEKPFYYEHTLLYLDPTRDIMAFIYPEAYAAEKERWRATMEADNRKFQAALPEKDRRAYGPMLFFGLAAFEEAMRREAVLLEEWEVAAAVAGELGLGIFLVAPSYAREKGIPGYLPVAPGAGAMRARLLAGLKTLVTANDRLAQYVAYMKVVDHAGAKWAEPPGRLLVPKTRDQKEKQRGA